MATELTHRLFKRFGFLAVLLGLSACGRLNLSLDPNGATALLRSTTSVVQFSALSSSGYENAGPWVITVTLSAPTALTVTVPLTVSGTATLNTDYTLSSTSLVFSPGSTSATVTLTSINDSVVEPDETIILTLGSPTNAILAGGAVHTFTLLNDDIDPFTIEGVQSSTLDTTSDAYLNFEPTPKIMLSPANGATSYDVTIYEADGTTVKCATHNTTTVPFLFTGCALTAGAPYKASVVAKIGSTISRAATNSPYAFKYNRAPVATDDVIVLAADGAAVIFDPRTNDSDPDGDTLTITGVSTPTGGTASFTATSVTYTPDTSKTGVQTFTYTISDGHGATATATVTARVMTRFTWTGAANDGAWNNAANWCGSVTTPGVSGVCAAAAGYPSDKTNTAHVAVFDATATHPNVTVNINMQAYGVRLSSDYAGTLTQASGVTIDIGASGWSQQGGTFGGSDSSFSIASSASVALDLEGGTFNAPHASMTVLQSGSSGSTLLREAGATTDFTSTHLFLRGDATGSPTYYVYFTAATGISTQSVNFESVSGSSADVLTISGNSNANAFTALSTNDVTIGRASGSGAVKLETGPYSFAVFFYGALLAQDGARAGSMGLAEVGSSGTYGTTGDGVISTLIGFGTLSPSTTDVSLAGYADFGGAGTILPSGTLSMYPFAGNADLRFDIQPNTNGGTVKFVTGADTTDAISFSVEARTSGGLHLNNLIYDMSGGTSSQSVNPNAAYGQLTVDGNLSYKSTARVLDDTNSYQSTSVAGNLTFDGIPDSFHATLETIVLNGTGSQTISVLNGSGFPFGNLDVANTSQPVSLTGDLNMSASNASFLTIESGAVLNANGHAISWSDGNAGDGVATVKINSGGILNMAGGLLTYESLSNSGTLNP